MPGFWGAHADATVFGVQVGASNVVLLAVCSGRARFFIWYTARMGTKLGSPGSKAWVLEARTLELRLHPGWASRPRTFSLPELGCQP